MPLLKKTIMWGFFLAAMYFGGGMTQSGSNFLQGMGFLSIVAALVCLYLVLKLIWGPLSQYMKLILCAGVVWFCAYSIGLFDGNTLQSFLSGKSVSPVSKLTQDDKVEDADTLTSAMFEDEHDDNMEISDEDNGGLVGKVKTMLFGTTKGANKEASKVFNPLEYPKIKGYPQVLSGSILYLEGIKIKLLGIDAPDVTQTCANRFQQSYNCGKQAQNWLQEWLNGKEVSCHILSKIEQGWATGSCFTDNNQYDVAAVVVNAGWAVAYTRVTDIYVPYERQAAEAHRGLWNGTFYKPWDWRNLQNRKLKVKINFPKRKKVKAKSETDEKFNFWGLF